MLNVNMSNPVKKLIGLLAGHRNISALAFSHSNPASLTPEVMTGQDAGEHTEKLTWQHQLIKRLVLKSLESLAVGKLIVTDGNGVFEFGDTGSDFTAEIIIRDFAAYQCFFRNGSIGAGEAYMQGFWDSPNLLNVIRLFCMNIDILNSQHDDRPGVSQIVTGLLHRLNANTVKGSKENISAHYDLGNDFFSLFLDKSMMYSSAVYQHAEQSLDQAAEFKLDLVCQKLQLKASDHLLEIGTGWGGMAIYAAQRYGCQVTTTTISQEQYDYASQAVKDAGMQDQITVLLRDYRELEGQYDKLVSIEMIEAVGYEYYREYFSRCAKLLKPEGLMCIQAITIADQRFERAKKTVDFIQRYIFPGGFLPSLQAISANVAEHTDMQIVHVQDIGRDYARTLNAWRERFRTRLEDIKTLGYADNFCRMWEYYLCYCEGGFLERTISTVQVVMAKPSARDEFSYL
ncbi:Tuberculostearic acid methyltransferase UfaA1 [Thalassocella blandensis]|nr:Tuberculostearic acid methyltransferase UfaA1 [Thalassocella blandensis]